MVDNNQDANAAPRGDEFPPLDDKASGQSHEEITETSESQQAEPQDEKKSAPEKMPGIPSTPPQKQPSSFLIRALRWTLGFLIVFGLGAITVIYFGLLPTQKNYRDTNQNLQTARQNIEEIQSQSQQEQANLQAEIDRLKTFENKNQELQNQLNQAELHVAILSAQNNVIAAQLALEKEDTNSASLALSQTPNTLDTISNMLEPNQRDVVTKMKDRLELATNGIDTNTYAALSDLDVLYNDLIKLENTLFSQP